MTKKRDNAYFLERLEAEHPDIWKNYEAGRYESVRAACIDAGLIKKRQNVPMMKTLWQQSSLADRAEFLTFLQRKGELLKPFLTLQGVSASDTILVERDVDDRSGWNNLPLNSRESLPLRLRDRLAIIKIMNSRGLKKTSGGYHVASVMTELEDEIRPRIPELADVRFKTMDPSLASALTTNWKLKPALLVALDEWLRVQSARQ